MHTNAISISPSSLLLAVLLPALAAAQQTTQAPVPILTAYLLPELGDFTPVGSVIAVAPGATTYSFSCAETTGTEFAGCNLLGGVTATVGPSTIQWRMSAAVTSPDFTLNNVATASCNLESRDAICVATLTESGSITSTVTETVENWTAELQMVTIASGLEKLPASTTGSVSSTGGGGNTPSTTSGGGSAPATTGTTSSSSAGAARMTAAAVLAGVAAVVGGAAMV